MTIKDYERSLSQHLFLSSVIKTPLLVGFDRVDNYDGSRIANVNCGMQGVLPARITFLTSVLGVTKSPDSTDCYFDKDNNRLFLGPGRVDIIAILGDEGIHARTELRISGNNSVDIDPRLIEGDGVRRIRVWKRRNI